MDPLTAAIIGGTGLISYIGGRNQNREAIDNSREQMAFQERMSSTAYQRAMQDMKLAGLNPILAYKQGGASSPAGSQAPVQEVLGKSASSALEARRLHKEIESADSVISVNKSQAALNNAQAIRTLYTKEGLLGQGVEAVKSHKDSILSAPAKAASSARGVFDRLTDYVRNRRREFDERKRREGYRQGGNK